MSNISLTKLGYPPWAQKELISGLSATEVLKTETQYCLYYHPRQIEISESFPSGWEIFKYLLLDQESFLAQPNDLIHRCVDISLLRSWEKRPSSIPSFCQGKLVGAWKSVFVGPGGAIYLPCLRCFNEEDTYVDYYVLSLLWHSHEPILMKDKR